jgi:hypothetical protein
VDPDEVIIFADELEKIITRYLSPHGTDDGGAAVAQAMKEYVAFKAGNGVSGTARAVAMDTEGAVLPHLWWNTYGDAFPALADVARKLLSKQASASPCERSWSALDVVMGKRRCSLLSSTLSKLLRVRQHLLVVRQADQKADKADIYSDLLWKVVDPGSDDYIMEPEAGMDLVDAADAAAVSDFLEHDHAVDVPE